MAETCKLEAASWFLLFTQVLECEFAEFTDVSIEQQFVLPRLCKVHTRVNNTKTLQSSTARVPYHQVQSTGRQEEPLDVSFYGASTGGHLLAAARAVS